jgi:chromosome segregation ATPase
MLFLYSQRVKINTIKYIKIEDSNGKVYKLGGLYATGITMSNRTQVKAAKQKAKDQVKHAKAVQKDAKATAKAAKIRAKVAKKRGEAAKLEAKLKKIQAQVREMEMKANQLDGRGTSQPRGTSHQQPGYRDDYRY